MHASTWRNLVIAAVMAMLAVACDGGPDETSPEPTNPPTTPSVQSAGEFQLVATVEHAFAGERPSIDLPAGTEGTLDVTPAPAVDGRVAPAVPGVMRVVLEDFNDTLRDRCAADIGERFKVFWTTGTQFDEALVSGDIEETIDRRRVGAIGTIFFSQSAGQQDLDELDLTAAPFSPAATLSPATTQSPGPGLATAEGETKCVLVAQQVGTSTGAVPTTQPRVTRRPTAVPTRSPTPSPTASPTPSPSPTATITTAPTASP